MRFRQNAWKMSNSFELILVTALWSQLSPTHPLVFTVIPFSQAAMKAQEDLICWTTEIIFQTELIKALYIQSLTLTSLQNSELSLTATLLLESEWWVWSHVCGNVTKGLVTEGTKTSGNGNTFEGWLTYFQINCWLNSLENYQWILFLFSLTQNLHVGKHQEMPVLLTIVVYNTKWKCG